MFPASIHIAGRALPAIGGATPTPWLDRLTYPWIAHFRGRLTNEGPSDNPLGLYFLFFSVGWLLFKRREGSLTERDCLLFCGLYAAYWIYSWGVLRYGAPMLFVLAQLTAHRLEALSARANRWVRRTAAVALAYCFAFALLPALILEVNPIQLRYFSRGLDKEGYLRAMLAGYPAIEYLNGRDDDEQRTLAFGNCATVYARDPARYRCVELRGAITDERVEEIAAMVEASSPDRLVLPMGPRGRRILPAVEALGFSEIAYEDPVYQVLERRSVQEQ